MNNKGRCLFLDRDGIINKDIGYTYKPCDVEFMPGIFQLCKYYQRKGYAIIIVTNQSGIARGYYNEDDFAKLNAWLITQFQQRSIHIRHIYHCPHHPTITGPCGCRKPQPGMLLTAIKQYQISPKLSIMVGDKLSDMHAAKRAGIAHTILLDNEQRFMIKPYIVDVKIRHLSQAIRLIP